MTRAPGTPRPAATRSAGRGPGATSARGRAAEAAAEAYLVGRGYRIVARNYRIRAGEVDRIGWDGPVLCFVEVRTRSGAGRGDPRETIGPGKRARLVRAAESYLAGRFGADPPACRFDVLAGLADPAGTFRFDLIRGAFDTSGS